MQVQVKLTDDQVDEIMVGGLQKGYEIHKTFPNEPNYYEIDQAFKTLLAYYMGDANYDRYTQDKANKLYNTQRLVDAYNGL